MTNEWVNADGLKIEYGRANKLKSFRPYSVKTFGNKSEIVFKFDLGDQTEFAAGTTFTTDLDNDGTKDGFTTGDFFIPAGSFVESAVLYMTDEAAAGGTNVQFGAYQQDGTVVDADDFITAANASTANMSANARVNGTGNGINTAMAQDTFVAMLITGTFTAGVGEIHLTVVTPLST